MDKRSIPIWLNLVVCVLPVLTFVGTRLILGGAALEVNYGYDVAAGQFPEYASRLNDGFLRAQLTVQVIAAGGAAWLGLIVVRRHAYLRRAVIVVPFVIIAALILSSRVTRTIGIVMLPLIEGFLILLSEGDKQ